MGYSEEKETLRKAAESAEALISQLEEKRQKFNQKIDVKLDPLRRILEAWESFSGKKPKFLLSPPSEQLARKRVRRGQVDQHINSVLRENILLSEPEIRETIKGVFKINYGRSTVYSALVRGQGKGKYEEKDNKWRMKQNRPTVNPNPLGSRLIPSGIQLPEEEENEEGSPELQL